MDANNPRVPAPVPPLVVLADRAAPLAEPLPQGSHERLPELGMAPEERTLLVRRSALLREDLARDIELADVVQEGGPVEQLDLARPQSQAGAR